MFEILAAVITSGATIFTAWLGIKKWRTYQNQHELKAENKAINLLPDKFVESVTRIENSSNNGLAATITHQTIRINKLYQEVKIFASDGVKNKFEHPFMIESGRTAMEAYIEALDQVNYRFWTTSYLSSGFWTQQHSGGIVEANRRLLSRLSQYNGAVRRIFQIDLPPLEKIIEQRNLLLHLRRESNTTELSTLREGKKKLAQRILELETLGCQTKIVCDQIGLYSRLASHANKYISGDTELAIYDNFRVDFFGGGSINRITDVTCYTDGYNRFSDIIKASEEYFSDLWESESAVSATEFLEELELSYKFAESQIDIGNQGLAKFDHPASIYEDERKLKQEELSSLINLIKKVGINGTIRKYLDVGTCTARYPIALQKERVVISTGEIIGIDIDPDCVAFAQGRCISLQDPPPSIKIIELDLMNSSPERLGRFDLITMMMGTISHFNWDGDNSLRKAIMKLSSLLSPSGLLIIGIWTTDAVKQLKLLETLYRKSDIPILASWSPAPEHVKYLFNKAGLKLVGEKKAGWQLQIFAFMHTTTSGGL